MGNRKLNWDPVPCELVLAAGEATTGAAGARSADDAAGESGVTKPAMITLGLGSDDDEQDQRQATPGVIVIDLMP